MISAHDDFSSSRDGGGAASGRIPALVFVLALAGFLSVVTELLPAALLTDISRDFDVPLAFAGSMTSTYAIGTLLTVIPLTRFAIRFHRRGAIAAVLVLFAVSNAIVAVSPTIVVALGGRFLGGVAHGVLWSLLPAAVERIVSARALPRAMALVFAANSLAIAAGAPLGAVLGHAVGWRTSFLIVAALGVVLAAIVGARRGHEDPQSAAKVSLWQATREPGALLACFAWALLMLSTFTMLTFIDAYASRPELEGDISELAIAVLGIAGVGGVALAARLTRHKLDVGIVGVPVTLIAAFVLMVVAPTSPVWVLVFIALWGVAFSATVYVYQRAVLVLGWRAPETVNSISVVLNQMAIAVGATVGGILVSTVGIAQLPLGAAGFAAIALLLVPAVNRRLKTVTSE
ncbi:MFS transporter [Microbacterium sp. GXF0217]